jgi:hypothetical protein
MNRFRIAALIVVTAIHMVARSQPEDAIRSIYSEALTSHEAYENLRFLCKNTKGRISGTPQAAAAVEFTRQVLEQIGVDTVFLQPVTVPYWKRGDVEYARMSSAIFGSRGLNVCGLGRSIGTGEDGVSGQVVEVHDFDMLDSLGEKEISGNIVFFNRPMDATRINTFSAYGGAVNQRTEGASRAARYGAIATVVRSVTTAHDGIPHTGVLRYDESIRKIPAISISTNDADLLSMWLKNDPGLHFYFISNCENMPDQPSYNVVGEIRGQTHPEEIITIGGHLDAWDTGEGAHDDGAGCIQAIEVLRLFKELGIQPKRTIRAVMFMDEEIGQTGGKAYAHYARVHNEKHYAALEADRGALTPRGFGFGASGERLEQLLALKRYFEPYRLDYFVRGGGGADIGPLREFGTLLMGYIPDDQRYFDYHHSAKDTFETVNERELQMGSASMATLIYLIDLLDL